MRDSTNIGFSLIEINLAIFVVAVGMFTLFSLFPAGMRQIEDATEETYEAFFADYVLNTLRSNAAWLTADQWDELTDFEDGIMQGCPIQSGDAIQGPITFPDASQWDDPDDAYSMRYVLTISAVSGGQDLYQAQLWCRTGEYGTQNLGEFKGDASFFATRFFYSGMP